MISFYRISKVSRKEPKKVGVSLLISAKTPKFKVSSSFLALIVVSRSIDTQTPMATIPAKLGHLTEGVIGPFPLSLVSQRTAPAC